MAKTKSQQSLFRLEARRDALKLLHRLAAEGKIKIEATTPLCMALENKHSLANLTLLSPPTPKKPTPTPTPTPIPTKDPTSMCDNGSVSRNISNTFCGISISEGDVLQVEVGTPDTKHSSKRYGKEELLHSSTNVLASHRECTECGLKKPRQHFSNRQLVPKQRFTIRCVSCIYIASQKNKLYQQQMQQHMYYNQQQMQQRRQQQQYSNQQQQQQNTTPGRPPPGYSYSQAQLGPHHHHHHHYHRPTATTTDNNYAQQYVPTSVSSSVSSSMNSSSYVPTVTPASSSSSSSMSSSSGSNSYTNNTTIINTNDNPYFQQLPPPPRCLAMIDNENDDDVSTMFDDDSSMWQELENMTMTRLQIAEKTTEAAITKATTTTTTTLTTVTVPSGIATATAQSEEGGDGNEDTLLLVGSTLDFDWFELLGQQKEQQSFDFKMEEKSTSPCSTIHSSDDLFESPSLWMNNYPWLQKQQQQQQQTI